MGVNSLFVLPAQMVDATLACRLIAGVSNQKFFSGVDSSAARPARAALGTGQWNAHETSLIRDLIECNELRESCDMAQLKQTAIAAILH